MPHQLIIASRIAINIQCRLAVIPIRLHEQCLLSKVVLLLLAAILNTPVNFPTPSQTNFPSHLLAAETTATGDSGTGGGTILIPYPNTWRAGFTEGPTAVCSDGAGSCSVQYNLVSTAPTAAVAWNWR
jgi:hypothetical protein